MKKRKAKSKLLKKVIVKKILKPDRVVYKPKPKSYSGGSFLFNDEWEGEQDSNIFFTKYREQDETED